MCQISLVNLHDRNLNEKLWLLMGTLGSQVKHDDGWGVADSEGNYFKCGIPMHYTTNSGEKIKEAVKTDGILLGHVRDASSFVPVNTKNAHPFIINDIVFVHNGKLTPKDEKGFIMDEQVPDIDLKTGVQYTDKEGKLLTKTVGRSDSLIFFEEFMKDWEADATEYASEEAKFVSVVNTTMLKFYGKFALVFIINGTFYVCRGKQAELNITFFRATDAVDSPVTGWAINTDARVLDTCVVLLNNINHLEDKPELHFSLPSLLTEETIFVAEDEGLRAIGKMKEGLAPVKTYPATTTAWKGNQTSANPTIGGNGNGATEDRLEKITRKIYNFMEDYSMSPQDIQILLYAAFGASTLEVNVDMLEIFHDEILLRLKNLTTGKIQKKVRKTNTGYIGLYDYGDRNYPWMLNDRGTQKLFVK